MNVRRRGLAAIVVLTLVVPAVGANGGRPPFPPAQPFPAQPPGPAINEDMGKVLSRTKAPYETVFDAKVKKAKLVIPQKFVSAGKAPADEAPRTGSVGGHGLMASLALSLGLVSGGLWWARRGTGGGRQRALLIVAAATGVLVLAASGLWADIAVPKGKGKGPVQPFPGPIMGGFGKMDVDVEITAKGSTIYLVLPAPNFVNPFGNPPPPGGFIGNPPPGGGFGGNLGNPPPQKGPRQEE